MALASDKARLNLVVDHNLRHEVDMYAHRFGRSRSSMAALLLRAGLEALKDSEDLEIVAKAEGWEEDLPVWLYAQRTLRRLGILPHLDLDDEKYDWGEAPLALEYKEFEE